jgi:hypothetical protein
MSKITHPNAKTSINQRKYGNWSCSEEVIANAVPRYFLYIFQQVKKIQ